MGVGDSFEVLAGSFGLHFSTLRLLWAATVERLHLRQIIFRLFVMHFGIRRVFPNRFVRHLVDLVFLSATSSVVVILEGFTALIEVELDGGL